MLFRYRLVGINVDAALRRRPTFAIYRRDAKAEHLK